jgi:hypothetical protein
MKAAYCVLMLLISCTLTACTEQISTPTPTGVSIPLPTATPHSPIAIIAALPTPTPNTALLTILSSDIEANSTDVDISVTGISSAIINIYPPVENLHISDLNASDLLLRAQINYLGHMRVDQGLGANPIIWMGEMFNGSVVYQGDTPLLWDVEINPLIPVALSIRTFERTEATLDLGDLNLMGLVTHIMFGDATIVLPEAVQTYQVEIATFSGSTVIDVPDGAAVRIETSQANVNGISVSPAVALVNAEQLWLSSNYDEAMPHISIMLRHGGLETFTIH